MFLEIWLLAAVSLGGAVLALEFLFRQAGSELGLDGFLKELILVLVTSALQAAVAAFVLSLSPDLGKAGYGGIYTFCSLITITAYKLAHRGDMEAMELGCLAATNGLVYLVIIMGIAYCTR